MIFLCLVRVACQTVSVVYFPTTEVATCSPQLLIFSQLFAKDAMVSIVQTLREYAIGRIVLKPLDKLGRHVYLVV